MKTDSLVRERLRGVKRLVVKVGSNVLTTDEHKPNKSVIHDLVRDLVELRTKGIEVALVTSGAVLAGMGHLAIKKRPENIAELQALAAVGQNLLMNSYQALFGQYKVPIGQVLLTSEDILGGRHRYVNLENTFCSLFDLGAVPVINENDSVAVDELRRNLGENDMLAAYVTNLINAELLIIYSDVEGLYTAFGVDGPEGELLSEVHDGHFELEEMVGESNSGVGRGGMQTKLRAAKLLMTCGEMTIIAHGKKHCLRDIVEGAPLGTLFVPSGRRLGSRERWIAFASPERGCVLIDSEAQKKIIDEFGSLFPDNILSYDGDFSIGDVVRIIGNSGKEIGRGITKLSSVELGEIIGKRSYENLDTFACKSVEVIHIDDLVLL